MKKETEEKLKPVDIYKTNVVDDKNRSVEFPVLNAHGENLGFSLMVQGAHSDKVKSHILSIKRKQEIEAENEKRRGAQKKQVLSIEAEDEKNAYEGAIFASKYVTGWVNVTQEFSEELRKTCRIITQKNLLMVCSNQIRQNLDAGPYGQRFKSPGGEAIGFYSSLRLKCSAASKIIEKKTIKGKEHKRVVGVKTNIEVFKSSVWKPYRDADVYILFDYGVDDIRANLKFVKECAKNTVYCLGDTKLHKSIDEAIKIVEEEELEQKLKDEVIVLWNEVEEKFSSKRKLKKY